MQHGDIIAPCFPWGGGGGSDALREGERSGQPATLDLAQWRKLEVLAELLRRRNGVELGAHQYQRLIRWMGFRLRKPSPQVAHADPLKIAAVKNTPPLSAKGRR